MAGIGCITSRLWRELLVSGIGDIAPKEGSAWLVPGIGGFSPVTIPDGWMHSKGILRFCMAISLFISLL